MFFPVLINLAKYSCLVIGGGNVAYRKVTSLQNFKAKITVVSPKICRPLKELSKKNKIKIINKAYQKDLLKDFEIIFCATDNPKLNLNVYQDCKKEKKILNVADVPELCDFISNINMQSFRRIPRMRVESKNINFEILPWENIILW